VQRLESGDMPLDELLTGYQRGTVLLQICRDKLQAVEDQIKATEGVECRKDADVIDEIPMAYKNIDAVMAAQEDLVEVVYTLKQVVCVKG